MDLKSPKSPGWKNKFGTFTRSRPRDDEDDIIQPIVMNVCHLLESHAITHDYLLYDVYLFT